MNAIKVTDPKTGELATIPQLAWRYQIKTGTLHWRYQQGRRGWDLVAPLNKQCKRGNAISNGIAKRREVTTPDRGELIQSARANPLTRPFSQISKEVR